MVLRLFITMILSCSIKQKDFLNFYSHYSLGNNNKSFLNSVSVQRIQLVEAITCHNDLKAQEESRRVCKKCADYNKVVTEKNISFSFLTTLQLQEKKNKKFLYNVFYFFKFTTIFTFSVFFLVSSVRNTWNNNN